MNTQHDSELFLTTGNAQYNIWEDEQIPEELREAIHGFMCKNALLYVSAKVVHYCEDEGVLVTFIETERLGKGVLTSDQEEITGEEVRLIGQIEDLVTRVYKEGFGFSTSFREGSGDISFKGLADTCRPLSVSMRLLPETQ